MAPTQGQDLALGLAESLRLAPGTSQRAQAPPDPLPSLSVISAAQSSATAPPRLLPRPPHPRLFRFPFPSKEQEPGKEPGRSRAEEEAEPERRRKPGECCLRQGDPSSQSTPTSLFLTPRAP